MRWLEAIFELLDEPTRDAWRELFELADRAGRHSFHISRDTLQLALDPLDPGDDDAAAWLQLRTDDDDLAAWFQLRTHLANRTDDSIVIGRSNL